jgi:ribonuclease Y
MSVNDAKKEMFSQVENRISKELALFIKNKEEEAEETAASKARELIALAIEKYAQDVTTEHTVSVVALPSDEMKGRIIGREGRNIRTLEQQLGVDLIIDDTPEVLTVSSFDPIRREIARLTLETLIKDGRIQPGRIEETIEKVKAQINEVTKTAGHDAAFKLGLPKINLELLQYIGRLKYRTSYGQSVYNHSMEVAYLAGMMAAELGLDQGIAKRAGLLHDIGKSLDFETDGSHVEIGVRMAKKYGESEIVINAIASHHGDVPPNNIYSVLVSAADTLSAARPGARLETLENYIKRIEQLETICKSYDGVAQSYAMQSGREVRVIVLPEKIDDLAAYKLARDIKERIESEMTYPGTIKVSVIRESRAVETAK